jgi:hypothetical protein
MTLHSPRLMATLLCALLGACQTTPPGHVTPRSSFLSSEPEGIRSFEKQQRELALSLEKQGALFEASQAWEVLNLLRPGEYGNQLAAVQERIDAKAQEHLSRARQEQKRGDVVTAEQHYLGVMGLQPSNKEAADALRAIERARIRQEHLLKPGRTQPPHDTAGKRPAAPVNSNPLLMEQASNLGRQGDYNEAIDLMAGQLKAVPGDRAARDLLAELLYKKALSLQGKDKAAAQATLKQCLQVAPKHAGCRAQLGAT